MTRDQAKRIAQAIFDDVEMSRLFSLDRVTDVIERVANAPSPHVRYIADVMAVLPTNYISKTIIWSPEHGVITRQPDQPICQPDD